MALRESVKSPLNRQNSSPLITTDICNQGQIVGNMWAEFSYNGIDPERECVTRVDYLMQDVVTEHCPAQGSWDS
jgi:hypothetical protein